MRNQRKVFPIENCGFPRGGIDGQFKAVGVPLIAPFQQRL